MERQRERDREEENGKQSPRGAGEAPSTHPSNTNTSYKLVYNSQRCEKVLVPVTSCLDSNDASFLTPVPLTRTRGWRGGAEGKIKRYVNHLRENGDSTSQTDRS